MLMALLVAVGGALLLAFLAHAYLPRHYGRPLALALGGPALALVIGAVALALYARTVCHETVITANETPDGSLATAIKAADCGDAASRSYDVSVARRGSDGQLTPQTILRSRGKPVPVAIAASGADHFTITLDDGSSRDVSFGADGQPDRVWSFINGTVVHGNEP